MLYFHEKTPDGFNCRLVDEVLCHQKTKYQTVTIVKHANLGKTLYLDGCFQADDSFQEEYHASMVAAAGNVWVHPDPPKDILIIGSGPGGLAKAVHEIYPEAQILGIELDREAFNLYKKYVPDWGPPTGWEYDLRFEDAFRFVRTEARESWDIILWDIDIDTCASPAMFSQATVSLAHCYRILKRNGVFVATAGAIQERDAHAPYTKLLDHLKLLFEGYYGMKELTRMNWNFFQARKK